MPLVVRNHLAHVTDVILLVLARAFSRVLLQDGDDLAPAVVTDGLAAAVVLGLRARDIADCMTL
jgi:hypothetical protein